MAKLKRRTQDTDAPAKEPWGPGPLVLMGLFLVGLGAYCFWDLFIGGAAEKWLQEGNDWYIPLNWGVMLVSAAAAAYAFVLAYRRSKKKAGAPPPAQPGE
jgi:hypothetical protein